ncbi:MAG: M28 family peptidase [Myxococcales bacterium]|nr:M28 family peptidase [Myxococcota bacterium]MDW8284137.1 M28 family peptidase [Myxococcales bacterium]
MSKLTSILCQPLPLLLVGLASAHAGPLDAIRAGREAITADALRAQVRFLSDDLLGGRQPGSPGDELARKYLAAQFESMGLLPAGEPVNGRAGYLQWVELVGMRSRINGTLALWARGPTVPVQLRLPPAEVVLVAGEQVPTVEVREAEVVFVGYGITAPEYRWDDYKGADLRGKVLLMMNNDPESDPALFAGRTRLYYGRWDYKYAEAARHGAVGALLIHTTPSAGYPWSVVQSSWGGENFAPPATPESGPSLKVRGWLTEEASRQLCRGGGHDLDALRQAAEQRTFRPVPLGVRMTVRLDNEIRRLRSANVLALLPGRDPKLREQAVVVTAHLDHLGTRPEARGPDKIYNGAMDNATGLAALLALARAAVLGPPPRRSLLFAAVTGEEDGLVGSAYLVRHRPAAAPVFSANINIDGLNIYGRSPHVVQIGRGKSTLDAVIDQVAAAQGRKVLPDQMPDKGSFYRSDQLNFARAGVPSVYLGAPVDLLGPDGRLRLGAGREQVERFIEERYHQPTDELREDWDFSGAVQDVQLLHGVMLRLANQPLPPTFRPGDEFASRR